MCIKCRMIGQILDLKQIVWTYEGLVLILVRHKVQELVEFVQDEERVREERKKAKKNKDKYVGMSGARASMHHGMTCVIVIIIIKVLFCQFISSLLTWLLPDEWFSDIFSKFIMKLCLTHLAVGHGISHLQNNHVMWQMSLG